MSQFQRATGLELTWRMPQMLAQLRHWVGHFKNGKKDNGDRRHSKEFIQLAYITSHKGGKSVLIMTKTLWKNNLNSVKDVPTTEVISL